MSKTEYHIHPKGHHRVSRLQCILVLHQRRGQSEAVVEDTLGILSANCLQIHRQKLSAKINSIEYLIKWLFCSSELFKQYVHNEEIAHQQYELNRKRRGHALMNCGISAISL